MNKKIKVLQITHDLEIGGLQRVIATLCKYIDRNTFDISVLCLRNLGPFQKEIESLGIPVALLPEKPDTVDYFLFLKAANFIKKNNFDVIHTHNSQPLLDAGLGNILAGKKRWIHSDHARIYPDKLKYIIYEWILSHFINSIVGVSPHTSECLKKYNHFAPKKIVTIPNGIVPDDFKISIDKNEYRHKLGIPPDGPVIGTIARLSLPKNLKMLLEAFAIIVKSNSKASLVIAGSGPLENELKEKAKELKLTNTFFLGARSDVPQLLQLFDLYALSSISEGLPMGILEAMASKCPIVSTDVGGIGTAIKHGINGSLTPTENAEAFAAEIIKVLQNKELADTYRKNGFDDFNNRFSGEVMTRQYEKLYLNRANC
jgi:glycosyltransferase involved in cell wall biosynthesis